MKIITNYLLAVILAMLLACGGGGSDSADSGSKVTFSTNLLKATRLQTDGTGIFFEATYSGELDSNTIYIKITDANAKISANTTLAFPSQRTARIGVQIADNLTAGIYTGKLDFSICYDLNCNQIESDSVSSLAYEFTIDTHINMTPLVQINSVDEWSTIQGGSYHRGYVDAVFDKAQFSPRWVLEAKTSGSNGVDVGHIAIVNGITYYVSYEKVQGGNGTYAKLHAVNEENGSEIWSYTSLDSAQDIDYLSSPTVSDGIIYFSDKVSSSQTDLVALNAMTGVAVFRTPMEAQFGKFQAPIVDEINVYSSGGRFGGIYAFDKFSGVEKWFSSYGEGSIALTLDNNYVYTLSLPCSSCQQDTVGFHAIDKTSGAHIFTIDNIVDRSAFTNATPIIINADNDNIILISGDRTNEKAKLVSYNTQSQSINWAKEGYFSTYPSVVGDRVYVGYEGIMAFNIVSGETVWQAPNVRTSTHSLVVSNNLLFYSDYDVVGAINLETKQVVWTYPLTGNIAISKNGVLYVTRDGLTLYEGTGSNGVFYYDHFLAAINLK